MSIHLLIVDALNLIRRIHAVQGSPCGETCIHALEQLIVHSQPTHVVAVFDDEERGHSCQQRVKSDPLTVTTNGLILIHLVYSGLASAITPAFRFCFSR